MRFALRQPVGVLTFGLIAAAAVIAAPEGHKPVFTIEQLGALARLSSPGLSPDGRLAVVVVSHGDAVENRTTTTLAVIDARTGAQRVVIVSPDASSASWSPRGDQIAWLAPDASGTVQINALSVDTRAAVPRVMTRAAQGAGIRAFAWSPDGASFTYLAEKPRDAPVGDARHDRIFEVADEDYLGTSSLARTRGEEPSGLWVIGAAGGEARLLQSGADHIADLAWQADGRSVLINTHPGTSEIAQQFGTIRAIGIAQSGETTVVPKPANVANEARIKVSPQGLLAFQRYRGRDPWTYGNNVAVVIDGQAREVSASLDRDINDFDWVGSGNILVVQAKDHLRTALWTVAESGAANRLDLGNVNPTWGLATSRSGALAFIGTEPAGAHELYVMASVKSKPVRLTHFNSRVAGSRLGRIEAVTWKSDPFEHDGVLTYPPDFQPGTKYPLLVNIHGGPHTSAQLSFNGENQFYAAQGWLVLEPNYRGSSGQGNRYQTAVIGDATAGPGRDIMAGIAAVKAHGIVDDARVALTGWSYGGVMTSWLIGQDQGWCAAIPGVLVVDFARYYDESNTGIWMETILGSPHLPENRSKYLEQSPASYLSRARTPTLMMQNVGDPNANVGQAYTLLHALKDRGVKSKLVIFGIDGHGPGDPFHERQTFVRTLSWMNENCGPARP